MTIVCGTDFSKWAMHGVKTAVVLAERLGQDLLLVHALEPNVEQLDAASERSVREALTKRLQADAGALQKEHSGVSVQVEVSMGAGEDVLRVAARTHHASILVVGSSGHASGALVRVGGVSERLANESEVPVLVVRDSEPFERWAQGKSLRALVGIDDSVSSDGALRFVEQLRRAAPLDAVVGRVYYADDGHRRFGLRGPYSYTDVDPLLESMIETDLKRRVSTLAGQGEVLYRARLGVGRLADHLIELGEAERCSLVVVGTHRHHGLGRMWSVSAGALHLARSAVAVVPNPPAAPGRAPPELKRVLVATDFSSLANVAIPWAYSLVSSGGEVTLAHVVRTGLTEELLDVYVPSLASGDQRGARLETELAARLRVLVPSSVRAVTRTLVLRSAEPAKALNEAAERLGVDAIVIATHGRTGLSKVAFGSVAQQVLQLSTRPVFLVRATP